MKLSLSLMILALSACATTRPQPKPAGTGLSPQTPGILTITGSDLRQTGRMELPDALRASSPIFH